jgi:hypothetical protein
MTPRERRRNLATTLKRRRRVRDPMAAFDRLPPPLRRWLAEAALPWSPASAARLYARALAAEGDAAAALDALHRAQRRLLARDAARVWGPAHPAAVSSER